jgi:hypothetical protein
VADSLAVKRVGPVTVRLLVRIPSWQSEKYVVEQGTYPEQLTGAIMVKCLLKKAKRYKIGVTKKH